jgi:hypothetical protein
MKAIEIATAHSVVIAQLVVGCLSVGWLAGCTAKSGDANSDEVATATELEPGKTAASLQLHTVAEQLEGNEIADVVALEAKINDPEAGLSAVDIDEDGVIDFVQVVEKREGDKTVLVLQAIPSSKKGEDVSKIAVEVARIELEVKDAEVKTADAKDADKTIVVHATYTERIHHDPEIHIYHHEVPVVVAHGTLVVAEGCFFHHVFVVEHDLYHGHHGDVVIEVHHDDHHKHKHHKHKGHGKGHGHGHGHGNDHGGVVIQVR